MRLLPTLAFSAIVPLLALAASAGCSDSPDATTGKRITLATKVAPSPEAKAGFTNAMGWNVKLSKALVSTGALYYFDGAVIFSQAPPRRPGWQSLFLRSAHAHPGHYIPGESRGEMLTPFSVDLLAEGSTLPAGAGVTGVVRSATFSFRTPAQGPVAAELSGHAVVLEGVASKGGDARTFRAELDAADLANTKGAPSVEGCPFTETTMTESGTVTLSLKVALWFDQVEFDSLPATPDGKAALMPAAAIARNELVRGMKAGDGYVFSYSKP